MTITFGQGIRIGQGITASLPQAVPVDLRFDTNYIGTGLGTSYNDTNLWDGEPGQYVCLTTEQMTSTGKYMTSWCADYVTDPANLIGIGTRAINLDDYLGSDTHGFGFSQDGLFYYNGASIESGFPTWGEGDVVDLAVDNAAGNVWIRVNGGNWNGSPTDNPATNTGGMPIPGGLTAQYFAVCIGGYSGGSNIAMLLQANYGVPSGFTFWGPGTTLTLTSADVGNGYAIYQNTTPLGTNGNEGFENTAAENWLGEGWFGNNLTVGAVDRFTTAMTDAGINPNSSQGYVWLVTWGEGSSIKFGLVKIGFYSGGGVTSSAYLDIQAIDPNDNNWETDNSNNGTSLVGTFKFPATFTIYAPLTDKNGWC